MSVRGKLLRAFFFLLMKRGWGAVMSVAVLSIVARHLDREDFGLLALAQTFLQIIQIFLLSGLSTFVIYRTAGKGAEKDGQEIALAAFWLNLFLTFLVIVIGIVGAPYWARFYNDTRIETILYYLMGIFFFSQLETIPRAILQKDFRYQRFVPVQMAIATLYQVGQAVLAVKGFGVFSLIYPQLVLIPIQSLIILYLSPLRVRLRFHIGRWKEIYRYTRFLIGSTFLNAIVGRADKLIIGKVLGNEWLGVYDIGRRYAHLFAENFMPMISSVFFPLLSQYAHDKERLRFYFQRMIELTGVVAFGVFSTQLAFARDIIYWLPGPQWKAAIPLLALFSIYLMIRLVSSPSTQIYLALGRPQIGLYFVTVFALVFVPAFYWASYYGLVMAVFVMVILRVLGGSVHFFIASRLLAQKVWTIYGKFFILFVVGVGQGALFFWLSTRMPLLYRGIAFGALMAIEGMFIYNRILKAEIGEILALVRRRVRA